MPRPGRRKRWEQLLADTPCLELVLSMWEDYWRLMDLENLVATATGVEPMYARKGALLNASRFREFLLQLANCHGAIAIDEFCGTPIRASCDMDVDDIAIELATWCLHSRRIYYVDAELQAVLGATSLGGVTWSDVSLPFHSFAIQLAYPITMADGTQYDFVVVSRHGEGVGQDKRLEHRIIVSFHSRKRYSYVPLEQAQLDEIQALIRQRKWQRASALCEKLLLHILNCLWDMGVNVPEEVIWNKEVTCLAEYLVDRMSQGSPTQAEIIANPDWQLGRAFDEMFRVVVGLVLYLKTLPSGSPHVSPPTKPFRSGLPDRKVITNRWEVCKVASIIPLTREERIFYGIEGNAAEQRQAKYELSCHFREGHWRRPPGLGSDPTAPRTVHVRPTIVRRDRLPKDGGLPAGATKSSQESGQGS